MSLVTIGEAATKVMDSYTEFFQSHPDVPWRNMRGMRNRMRMVILRSTLTSCRVRIAIFKLQPVN